jgi:hypothetical protein
MYSIQSILGEITKETLSFEAFVSTCSDDEMLEIRFNQFEKVIKRLLNKKKIVGSFPSGRCMGRNLDGKRCHRRTNNCSHLCCVHQPVYAKEKMKSAPVSNLRPFHKEEKRVEKEEKREEVQKAKVEIPHLSIFDLDKIAAEQAEAEAQKIAAEKKEAEKKEAEEIEAEMLEAEKEKSKESEGMEMESEKGFEDKDEDKSEKGGEDAKTENESENESESEIEKTCTYVFTKGDLKGVPCKCYAPFRFHDEPFCQDHFYEMINN